MNLSTESDATAQPGSNRILGRQSSDSKHASILTFIIFYLAILTINLVTAAFSESITHHSIAISHHPPARHSYISESIKDINNEIIKLQAARRTALHFDHSSSTNPPATASLVRKRAGPWPPEVISRKRKISQDQEDIGYNKIARKEETSESTPETLDYDEEDERKGCSDDEADEEKVEPGEDEEEEIGSDEGEEEGLEPEESDIHEGEIGDVALLCDADEADDGLELPEEDPEDDDDEGEDAEDKHELEDFSPDTRGALLDAANGNGMRGDEDCDYMPSHPTLIVEHGYSDDPSIDGRNRMLKIALTVQIAHLHLPNNQRARKLGG